MSSIGNLDFLSSKLYSAVVSDICDSFGQRERTAPAGIVPLLGHRSVLVGWARTACALPIAHFPDPPYAREIAFLDSLQAGEVVVATTGGAEIAFWGELFSSAAVARGARGAVVDGFVRDQVRIDRMGFPVFARGARPTDSHGRLSIAEQDCVLDFGGVAVATGDLVIADSDGVVFVPQAVASDVIERAMEKASLENSARDLLQKGALLADVWERYQVL